MAHFGHPVVHQTVIEETKENLVNMFPEKEALEFVEYLDCWYKNYLGNPVIRFGFSHMGTPKEEYSCVLSAEQFAFRANGHELIVVISNAQR